MRALDAAVDIAPSVADRDMPARVGMALRTADDNWAATVGFTAVRETATRDVPPDDTGVRVVVAAFDAPVAVPVRITVPRDWTDAPVLDAAAFSRDLTVWDESRDTVVRSRVAVPVWVTVPRDATVPVDAVPD